MYFLLMTLRLESTKNNLGKREESKVNTKNLVDTCRECQKSYWSEIRNCRNLQEEERTNDKNVTGVKRKSIARKW